MDVNSGLFTELLAAEVIDSQENDELQSTESSTRKIERLLSMLSRKSIDKFKAFLTALDKTGQRHLADTLRRQQLAEVIPGFDIIVAVSITGILLDLYIIIN
jgi:Caspase recruitment domain